MTVAYAIAELHTAVVDGNECIFQVRWFSMESNSDAPDEPALTEVRNAIDTIAIDHDMPLLTQLTIAFKTQFPQATRVV